MSDGRGGKREGAGRPKGSVDNRTLRIRKIFQPYAEQAVSIVAEIMEKSEAPDSVRLNAAKIMIERAWGRVKDEELSNDDQSLTDEEYAMSVKEILTDEEYDFLSQIEKKLEQAGK